jgi:hypothetical protein
MAFIEAFKRAYQLAYYRWRLKLERQREIYRQVQRNGAIEVQSTKIED